MKTQTVRQISISKIPSRQVHDALVHAKKQATHVDEPHTHGATTESKKIPADVKKSAFHFHEYVHAMTPFTIVRFGDDWLASVPEYKNRHFSAPRSQYDAVKGEWSKNFLSVSKETSKFNA